jgi:hypothetical protein
VASLVRHRRAAWGRERGRDRAWVWALVLARGWVPVRWVPVQAMSVQAMSVQASPLRVALSEALPDRRLWTISAMGRLPDRLPEERMRVPAARRG